MSATEVAIESSNELIKKGEKRKSRLRPIPVIQQQPKIRIVKFKYDDKIESLPIDCELKVRVLSNQLIEENDKDSEKSENKNGKTKTKHNKSIRRIKPITISQPNTTLKVKLPEASFRVLKQKPGEYREPSDSSLAYHRFIGENNEEDERDKVEYDMDEEDSIWLDIMNKKRKSERLLDVDADTFELIMDRLEKESFFQSQYNGSDVGPAIDEDAVCCICNDGECQNSNAILFCDMCNLAVHQECYGVPYIPEGQWLCRRCMQSPSRAVDCVLCPNKGGAFKQTDDNRWAHVICALWIPEVCFANTVFLEPVDSITAIPTARWKLVCCVCHQKNSGACIQCHKSNCYVAFHVTCAQQAGLYMRIEAVKESTPQGVVTSIRKTAYCFNHAPKSGSSNKVLYSSCDEEPNKIENKRNEKIKDKMKKARKILAEKRCSIPVVSIPTIPIECLSRIAEEVTFPRRNEFLIRLYAYWKLKRQSRNGAPLLRRLQSSNSILKIDLNKEKSKRDYIKVQNQYQKLVQLRCDLEKVRLLLELIRKRERLKLKYIKESRMYYIYRLNPFKQFLLNILDRVVEKDVNQFFLEPVSTADVPDYLTFIQSPMDLGTMRRKVEDNRYTSFDEFENDLNLIVNNCKFYNEQDTIWHKAAVKLKTFIDNIIQEYRPLADNYNQQTGLHL